MGRCYEFGVLVGEGCEHAMVVPDPGGRCECATCGARCAGRFAACAAIIESPGYVPVTAPAWAVAVGNRSDRAPLGAGSSAGPGLGAGVPAQPEPAEAAADLVGALEGVAKQLAEHDVELATRLDSLAERVAELQRQVTGQESGLQAVLARLAAVDRKLDELPFGPLFGPPRRQS
ncbi:MAG: hypothetical protein ACRD0N_01560 [Acidimicrobiales bacterium]